jgi:hypothetical protein
MSKRVQLSRSELDYLMPEGKSVHTLAQAGGIFIGADWEREDILKYADSGDAELSGPEATAMNHGAVINTGFGGWIFIATKTPPQPGEDDEDKITKSRNQT